MFKKLLQRWKDRKSYWFVGAAEGKSTNIDIPGYYPKAQEYIKELKERGFRVYQKPEDEAVTAEWEAEKRNDLPPAVLPSEGAVLCRLRDVPKGWEYRDGLDDRWFVMENSTPSEHIVEARPLPAPESRWTADAYDDEGHFIIRCGSWSVTHFSEEQAEALARTLNALDEGKIMVEEEIADEAIAVLEAERVHADRLAEWIESGHLQDCIFYSGSNYTYGCDCGRDELLAEHDKRRKAEVVPDDHQPWFRLAEYDKRRKEES